MRGRNEVAVSVVHALDASMACGLSSARRELEGHSQCVCVCLSAEGKTSVASNLCLDGILFKFTKAVVADD